MASREDRERRERSKMDAIADRAREIFDKRFTITDIINGDVHEMHSECYKQAREELKNVQS